MHNLNFSLSRFLSLSLSRAHGNDPHRPEDGFLVEYRQSGSGQIATWKFMKKVYSHVLIQNSDYPNMLEDANMQRNIGIDVDEYNIYKCNFQSLNEQLQSLTSKVI